MKKILLLVLGLSLTAPAITIAQEKVKIKKHEVKMKPKAPKYTKVVSPGTTYVYINDDWTWDDGTSTWVWNGNRWVVPPASQHWIPGHWSRTSNGWEWTPGYWK